METVAGNRIIAEFMGYKFNAYPDLKHNNITKPNETEWYYASWDLVDFEEQIKKKLQYHTSWDWLMPVVEKIEAIVFDIYTGFSVDVRKKYCVIYCHYKSMQDGCVYQTPYGFTPDSKINATWLAVISFIQWYNQNNTGCLKQKA